MMISAVRPLVSALAISVALLAVPLRAETVRPLLMEGKVATFQRILTKPGSTLQAEQGAAAGET